MVDLHPKAGRPWLRPSLARITFLIWLAWIVGAALMWGMYRWRVMHPHFLPLTTLLAMQVIGGLAVLLAGLWRFVRGPQRANALGWVFLGTTPLWLWAAHISYGIWVGHNRFAPRAPGPVIKLGAPGASALLDGFVRYQYPNRLKGQRVVMIYDQVPDPTGDLAAMDRAVEQMEELLGRRCKTKVHWVRGSVIGLGPKYNQGLALGTDVTRHSGLTSTDRHEVAHFVLHHHCGPDRAPPSILVEGWAQTQSVYEPGSLARRAWKLKQNDNVLTLRELTGNDWYNSKEGHVYTLGGALVDFILREYGPSSLFELYTSCRPESFGDDCRRILGIGLDELDRRYWADLAEQAAEMGHLWEPHPFQHVELDESIDPEEWNAFVAQYLSAQKQLEAPYRQVQMEIESSGRDRLADGTTATSFERLLIARDGNRYRRMCEKNGHAVVVVADPRGSFRLHRELGASQWTRANLRHSDTSKLTYSSCRRDFQFREDFVRKPGKRLSYYIYGSDVTITAFERFVQDGQNLVRIRCRDSAVGVKGQYLKHGSLVFLPDAHCTLQSASSSATHEDGKVAIESRLEIEYGPTHEGIPVVREIRSESETSDGRRDEFVTRIRRCDFVPTPEKEFTLGAFDVDPPGRWAWLERMGVPWYAITTWFGAAISLVLGVAIQGWRLMRKKPHDAGSGADKTQSP